MQINIKQKKETFSSTSVRHPIKVNVKIGSDREGNIKAIHMKALNNTGDIWVQWASYNHGGRTKFVAFICQSTCHKI